MQHKKELGDKYVKGVRILRNERQQDGVEERADLVFDIADHPPDEPMPDAPHDPTHDDPDTHMPDAPPRKAVNSRKLPRRPVHDDFLVPNIALPNRTIAA
jgi:hypothetical protein